MASQPSSIQYLHPESQAQIRSSVVISSLNDVVIGLLENSLDARATCADIRLDYVKGYCSVIDNGTGIPAPEFGPDGHLGSLHWTSKLDVTRSTYGRYGRFLYHITALSLLSITSRCSSPASTIMLHRAKVVARSYGDGERAELIRGEHGTHVVVTNLFGDIPVRYRHIAARLESIPQADAEFSTLKKRITALVLACGRAIDIKVLDIRAKRIYKQKIDTLERKSSFELPAICSTLHQAGYIEYVQDSSFRLVSVQTSSIRIRAAVSLHPAPSRDIQFVSIGIRPMLASASACLFQAEINAVFELSAFGAVENDIGVSDKEQERRRKDRRFASDSHTNRQLNALKKGVDRWPIFYVRIDPQDPGSSIGLDSEQSEDGITEKWIEKVLTLLRSMFYEFLSVHHFRPRAKKSRRFEKTSIGRITVSDTANSPQNLVSPAIAEPLLVPRYFNAWSRVKTGISPAKPTRIPGIFEKADFSDVPDIGMSRLQTPTERVQHAQNALGSIELQTLDDADLELLAEDFHDDMHSNADVQHPNATEDYEDRFDADAAQNSDADEAAYLWTDPTTGIEHKINARNGFIIPHTHHLSTQKSVTALAGTSQRPWTPPAHTIIPQRIRTKPTKKTPTELIASLQQSDLIRSFRPLEARIPSIVPDDLDDVATAQQAHNCIHSHRKTSEYFSASANIQSHNLSKTDLESARVIAQVDQKFILVQTQQCDNTNPLLVLVDQHAADERVKVEELYSQLCAGKTTTPVKPMIFEVPQNEIELFARHQMHFAEWQIIYSIKQRASGTYTTQQVVVTALPSLISERCRLDPTLLIDLLRREVHQAPLSSQSRSKTSSKHNWIHRIPLCPAGLLEMVNSRACRSAIMFNDVLDIAQCGELLRRLVKCVLPFQCAHGRPSCVALPGWGRETGEAVEAGEEEVDFMEGWRRWKNL